MSDQIEALDPTTIVEQVIAGDVEIEIHHQPIVALATGEVVGYESLSRFPDRTRPDLVFAAAARAGLGAALQRHSVRAALKTRADLPAGCFLTLNLEPEDLGDEGLLAVLQDAAPLHRVFVEVTEKAVLADERIVETLAILRTHGAAIAIDDVSAGYAGLQELSAIRPRIVKADESLVSDLHRDPIRESVVRMLGKLADELDAKLLVEGVERRDDMLAAVRLGVPLAQGYLFGRPAAGFPTVSQSLRDDVRLAALEVDDLAGVGALCHRVPVVPHGGRAPEDAAVTVLLDEQGRPATVVVHGIPSEPLLVAERSEPLERLALRLSTQPSLPTHVVVVGTDRTVVGVIDVRDVLRAVTSN